MKMDSSKVTFNLRVMLPSMEAFKEIQEDLDMTWYEFVIKRLNVYYHMKDDVSYLKSSKLSKIVLDGNKLSECCYNFGNIKCCKSNKTLGELDFQEGSTITYYFDYM